MGKEKLRLDYWGWAGLAPLILVGLLVLVIVFNEIHLAFWDYRVHQQCKVDGGETVYKKLFLDKEEYARNLGSLEKQIIAPTEGSKFSIGHSILARYKKTILRKYFPVVSRNETTIVRASDKEVLAKSVSYSRGGGAITILFSYDSGYSCGGSSNIAPMLSRTVFLKEKTNDN